MSDEYETREEYKAALGGKFLHPENFIRDQEWVEARVTIDQVFEPETIQQADKKMVKDWVISIRGREKYIVLNKTNVGLITLALGTDNVLKWPGKQITLYPVTIDAFGEKGISAFRVRTPLGVPVSKRLRNWIGEDLVPEDNRTTPPKPRREAAPATKEEEPEPGDQLPIPDEEEGGEGEEITTDEDSPDQEW